MKRNGRCYENDSQKALLYTGLIKGNRLTFIEPSE